MAREPIPTHCFALVVVRLGRRFLLVHERKHGQLWYLPAGRVEPSESFVRAAERETLEEAGVPIVVDGVLRVQHAPRPGGQRLRVIFTAHPADDTPPQDGARRRVPRGPLVYVGRMEQLSLRGDEVSAWCRYVAEGGSIYPLGLLTPETAPP